MSIKKKSKAGVAAEIKQPKKKADKKQVLDAASRMFPVVGVGSSAGGLAMMERFFSNVPSPCSMAFIVVPHLDRTAPSQLPEILQRCAKLKIIEAESGRKIEPDHIYVIPPGKLLGMSDGKFVLNDRPAKGSQSTIDHFFISLAEEYGDYAVGVVLSGMGSDGAKGIKAIKDSGGITLAQELGIGEYDAMPRAAMDTGLIDYILPPEKMPEAILRYGRMLRKLASAQPLLSEADQQALSRIFSLLRSSIGHDFSSYKRNTMLRRIERRMIAHDIDTIARYFQFMQNDDLEVRMLLKELLIGVTAFFRDSEAFKILEGKVIPGILDGKSDNDSIRVWIPGCSTGEEAYSIAILFREYMEKYHRSFNIQIFATDLADYFVEKAREGRYSASVVSDLSKERLQRYFVKENDYYRIDRSIREMLIFAPQNAVKDPPFTKLDLISCRNMLIYLDADLQKRILAIFHYSLKPEGLLFLGPSETLGDFNEFFTVVDNKWKIFQKKNRVRGGHPLLDIPLMETTRGPKQSVEAKKTDSAAVFEWVRETLLEKYAPACVLINKKGDILYIHGRTGSFLEPSPGKVSWNIHDMAREGLNAHVRLAVQKAAATGREYSQKRLRVKSNGHSILVNLDVLPFKGGSHDDLLLVMFEETPEVKPGVSENGGTAKGGANGEVDALHIELKNTKESLQSTIEELETSNEELKSINEEYQSTNEELKSANEELETSREEMQSLNEELATVNTELQGKILELSKSHQDMKNFLDSLQIPTVFLDNDLCIKRFTKQSQKLINIIHTDVGRPLAHLVPNFKYDAFIKDVREVQETLNNKDVEIQASDGSWYLMRIFPYRTMENQIEGVVINFVEIQEFKDVVQQKLKARAARNFGESVINLMRQPVLVLRKDLTVVSANEAYYSTFNVSERNTAGRALFELGGGQWNIPEFHALMEKELPDKKKIDDFVIQTVFPHAGYKKIRLKCRVIEYNDGLETERILLSLEDISGN